MYLEMNIELFGTVEKISNSLIELNCNFVYCFYIYFEQIKNNQMSNLIT